MPQDNLDQYYGTTCLKCNAEPREPHQKWGARCLSASHRWWADYTAQTAREEMGYVPARPAPAPQPAPAFQPRGLCPRCGAANQWVDRGEHQWACVCGFDPAYPDQPKPV